MFLVTPFGCYIHIPEKISSPADGPYISETISSSGHFKTIKICLYDLNFQNSKFGHITIDPIIHIGPSILKILVLCAILHNFNGIIVIAVFIFYRNLKIGKEDSRYIS